MKNLKISSSAFNDGVRIPQKYTCDGEDVMPPLTIENVPSEAKSLILWIEDTDAPLGVFSHMIVYNIPFFKTEFIEGEKLSYPHLQNDFGSFGYKGPCPPNKIHRYYFKVYALDKMLDVPPRCNKKELRRFMAGHVIDEATLIGLYGRK